MCQMEIPMEDCYRKSNEIRDDDNKSVKNYMKIK